MAIRRLASPVWGNANFGVWQEWGPTTLALEPYFSGFGYAGPWHCGIDVAMDVGTPLHAARAGTVVNVGPGQLGIAAATAELAGEVDWYIHISQSVVGIGQSVARGQLVAYSGNVVPSGGATTGPHLHFERTDAGGTRYNVPPALDPNPILAGLYGPASGSLGDHMDLSNPVDKAVYDNLNIIHDGLFKKDPAAGILAADGSYVAIQDAIANTLADVLALSKRVDGVAAAVAALKPAAAPDLSAIQASLTALNAKVDIIAARVTKDLA